MYAPVIKIFRLMAAEFAAVDDDTVTAWIELTSTLVSRKRFGNLWSQALALYTAHRMKVAQVGVVAGEDPMGDIGKINPGNLSRVASYSEGEVSISFNSNQAQLTQTDAELAMTEYGVQYLSLRRMRIASITSAGEPNARS